MVEYPNDNDDCGCLGAVDPEHGYPHTVKEHYRDSCRCWPPCGGCYSCMAMQIAHYNRLESND